jgi:hypothetical protein
MPEPPALKREIVIDNFARGGGIQVLKEGLEHAVDCAITHDPTRTPSTYPTSNSDDRHAKRARPTGLRPEATDCTDAGRVFGCTLDLRIEARPTTPQSSDD